MNMKMIIQVKKKKQIANNYNFLLKKKDPKKILETIYLN